MSSGSRVRRSAVVALTVVGCLVSIISVVTVWGRNQVLDTERYLASVTPLATDPVIQDEVARKVAEAITERLDTTALARESLPPRAGVLAGPLGAAVDDFIERTTVDFVHSDAFATLWTEVNRTGHTELVRLLRGEQAEAIVVQAGRLSLDLTPVVGAVRDRLVLAGLDVVGRLPQVELVVDVASAQGIERAQVMVRRIHVLAILLPILAILLLLTAVALTRRRWTGAAAVLAAAAWSMLLLRGLLAIGDGLAASRVPAEVASEEAVAVYYEHLTSLLRQSATVVGIVLALLAAGLVVGPGVVALRRGTGLPDELRASVLVTIALAGLVLLVWPSPGPAAVVLVLAVTVATTFVLRTLLAGEEPSRPAPG